MNLGKYSEWLTVFENKCEGVRCLYTRRAARQTLLPPLAQRVICALGVFEVPAANASVPMPSISLKSPCVNVRNLGSHDAPRGLESSHASPDYRKTIHNFKVRSGLGSGENLR